MLEYNAPELSAWLIHNAPHLAAQLLIPDRDTVERFFTSVQKEPALAPFFTGMPVKNVEPPVIEVPAEKVEPLPIPTPATAVVRKLADNERRAALKARNALRLPDVVIFDTETTGKYTSSAEIVHIGAIDLRGNVLLDQFIKPSRSIPAEVTGIHGITDEMVKDAPEFTEAVEKIAAVLNGKHWIIYNSSYDAPLLESLIGRHKTRLIRPLSVTCAMLAYAEFYGEFNSRHGNYKWQSLTNACKQQGIEVVGAHQSLGDCKMTWELMKKMADALPEESKTEAQAS